MSVATIDVTQLDMEPRDLAALAGAFLLLESARLYGFVDGGPDVNVDRCEQVIAFLRDQGVTATEEEIEQKVIAILAELGAVRA